MNKIIKVENDKLIIPDIVIIPFIEGDGTGADIWKASQPVIDEAIKKAYNGKRKIEWLELMAGEKGFAKTGSYLSDEVLKDIEKYRIAIKGPLTTPVGKGIKSLNVTIRQKLDLYACIRPVKYFAGVPSPMKNPEKIDMCIFRENTEDLYAGIEWEAGTDKANKVIKFLKDEMNAEIVANSGIGIKPMSRVNSQRLIRMAFDYAIKHNLPSITLMHKGNIMKWTEGAFAKWGYELLEEKEYKDKLISEKELFEKYNGKVPEGKVIVKDRIADMLFQQVLLRPDEFSVIATPNLNGDYISDAVAAQAGGLGMAPGANIGKNIAVFEATHGSAPKYAGQNKVNPGSVILSAVMMLEYIAWEKPAKMIKEALQKTILAKTVTYDLARQMNGAKEISCSEFGKEIIKNL